LADENIACEYAFDAATHSNCICMHVATEAHTHSRRHPRHWEAVGNMILGQDGSLVPVDASLLRGCRGSTMAGSTKVAVAGIAVTIM